MRALPSNSRSRDQSLENPIFRVHSDAGTNKEYHIRIIILYGPILISSPRAAREEGIPKGFNPLGGVIGAAPLSFFSFFSFFSYPRAQRAK